MRVSVFAPAKINLSLHVGRARADGRHELVSLVAFADVGDVLTLEAGPFSLSIDGPFAAALEGENLITRALQAVGVSARVHLEKNLPVAAGLGGGSADAAAALRGAAAFAINDLKSLEIAARALGADVPVCLHCAPALMTGAGEAVTRFAMAPLAAVLVNPGVPVATGDVFRRFDEMGLGGGDLPSPPPPDWKSSRAAIEALRVFRNDLEAPARRLAPAIGDVLARLEDAPGAELARMSGSGATCFALMENADAAANLAAALRNERPHWWSVAAKLGEVDAAPTRL